MGHFAYVNLIQCTRKSSRFKQICEHFLSQFWLCWLFRWKRYADFFFSTLESLIWIIWKVWWIGMRSSWSCWSAACWGAEFDMRYYC